MHAAAAGRSRMLLAIVSPSGCDLGQTIAASSTQRHEGPSCGLIMTGMRGCQCVVSYT